MSKFLFVGERPSPRAEKIGATWQNGRLAGKTLRDALVALNIPPDEQEYCNLYKTAEKSISDSLLANATIREIIEPAYRQRGLVIVGMGQIVCRVLNQYGIPHLQIIHPAARGYIRATDRYQAHIAEMILHVFSPAM
jgi:hypothetical protein